MSGVMSTFFREGGCTNRCTVRTVPIVSIVPTVETIGTVNLVGTIGMDGTGIRSKLLIPDFYPRSITFYEALFLSSVILLGF